MAGRSHGGCSLFQANVYRQEVPDGGWGWLVAAAFFLVEVFTYGAIKSFGVFLQDLVHEFDESNSRVSWIVSICVFVMTVMAPLSSVLTNRFGFQPVVMLGGCLIAMGTISTSFTTSINQMYFTTGIVAGLGYCLTFLPTVTILSQYFDRRRSLVTSVASTGESLAMLALAPAMAALRDRAGWRLAMAVLGALQASVVACGALLRPIVVVVEEVEEEKREEEEEEETVKMKVQTKTKVETKLLDFSVLRDGGFVCYALFGLFATAGFFAPPLYVIDLAVSRGVPRSLATTALAAMAAAEVPGRLVVGWLMSWQRLRRHKLLVLLACVAGMVPTLMGFAVAVTMAGLAACSAAYGFFMGAVACSHIPLLAEEQVAGVRRMASAAGVYVFIQSFAGLAGPPLGGYLVDVTGNFGSAFYFCASGMALGAVFLALVPTGKRYSLCKEHLPQEEVTHQAEGEGGEECRIGKDATASRL